MRGHEQILEARERGYKPTGWVWVDVGQNTGWQKFLLEGNSMMLNDTTPLHPQVCLAPNESARTADWTWCIGLMVQVDGDDPVRVMAAHERIAAAGAARVFSTCGEAILIDSAQRKQLEVA